MLHELEISNFLSYEHVSLKFTPDATIAVVGENGHGKSGLLESILFVLYGEGRDDLSKLVRIGSDGAMSVKLTLTDTPVKGKKVVIERGVKAKGAGYTKIWMNEALLASGGAKPSNNPAQEYINTMLGVDKDSFLLTSFFGMGSNDALMQVVPSERLETLQKLAGVDICMEFNKIASDYAKGLSVEIAKDKAVLSALEDSGESAEDINSSLTEKIKELNKKRKDVDALQIRRTELSKNETKYQNLLRELDKIRVVRENKLLLKEKVTKSSVRLRDTQKSLKQEASDLLKQKQHTEQVIGGMGTEKALIEEISVIRTKMAVVESEMELRLTAINMPDGQAHCPLCNAPISDSMKEVWQTELKYQEKEKNELHNKNVVTSAELDSLVNYKKKLDRLNESMESNVEEMTDVGKQLTDSEKELHVVTADLEKADVRITAVRKELKAFNNLVTELADADSRLGKLMQEVGMLTQTVADLRKRLKKCSENRAKMDSINKLILENTENMLAYKVVADAFSRYAIPVLLLRNLRIAIERRATSIYQYFTNGAIKIADVPGARPGVEFVLHDEMGSRPYKALSTGEKVMVFLAIRVAITQIINASRNNKVEFLILDEIAGNLSATRRDALTKLVNSLLRKFFTQIFMVSHVDVRDIFNETLFVHKKNGVSRVRVSA